MAVLGPLILVFQFSASWQWMAFGALAWILGVAAKFPLSVIWSYLGKNVSGSVSAAVLGTISSASELGVAGLVLVWAGGGTLDAAGITLYAISAGATEILVLGGFSVWAKDDDETTERWEAAAKKSICVRHIFFIERMIALAGHTGSRGLICLSIIYLSVWPAVVAVVTFMVTDAVAAYGEVRKWDWLDPSVCRRLFGLLGVISAVELVIFVFALFLFV